MDVFGPWYIKEGRKELKRWGIVFTCLSSRAIHLETLNTMETSSFINALRRFINRRGKVRQLRSDQGSNFIGGRNELNAEVNTDAVKNFLLTQECDFIEFKMNFPSSSHMGGVWERMIRTVRSSLSGLLEDHSTQLDDEGLRTLFTEAENLVNSRPLTTDNLSDPQAPEPITPNHLLTLKTKQFYPRLATSLDQICTPEKDGAEFNSWLTNSGSDGKENIVCSSKSVRSGTRPSQTSKLMILF